MVDFAIFQIETVHADVVQQTPYLYQLFVDVRYVLHQLPGYITYDFAVRKYQFERLLGWRVFFMKGVDFRNGRKGIVHILLLYLDDSSKKAC